MLFSEAKTRAVSAASSSSELKIVTGSDLSTLDPDKSTSATDLAIVKNITDSLVRTEKTPQAKVGPRLALSWKPIEPTRWRFELRQGVKFHNGDDFDAESAKWAIDYQLKNSLNAPVLSADHTEVVSKYTLDIITKFPDGLFPLELNYTPEMLNRQWMTSAGYSPAAQVGTGPGKFAEWSRGDHLTLDANEHFWGRKLSFSRVVYRPVPEAVTRANAAIAGEADIVTNILPQDMERVKAGKGVRIERINSTRCATIRIADQVAPFDNKLVRQALNYAVNVPAIVKDVFKGIGAPLQGQFQGAFAANWQPDVKAYPHDPDKAKHLLAQAGYASGFQTQIGTSRGKDANDYEFVTAVAGQLKDVGIDAEVVVHEAADYLTMYSGKKRSEPLFYWSSGNLLPDAQNAFRDLTLTGDAIFNVHAPELNLDNA
jgi:peptide/nickel transport system substrate-binding protein